MPTSRVSSMPSMCTPGASSTRAARTTRGRKRRAGTAPWRVGDRRQIGARHRVARARRRSSGHAVGQVGGADDERRGVDVGQGGEAAGDDDEPARRRPPARSARASSPIAHVTLADCGPRQAPDRSGRRPSGAGKGTRGAGHGAARSATARRHRRDVPRGRLARPRSSAPHSTPPSAVAARGPGGAVRPSTTDAS